MISRIKNLLFDFDGTLHDTIRIYAPAFRRAYDYLIHHGLASPRDWDDGEISTWLGYSSRDMWAAFMPGLPEEEREFCSRMIGAEMLALMKAGQAHLYDGVPELLNKLKSDGYCLIFLSNCKLLYMQESIRQFSLDRYFTAFYCTEQFDFAPKHEVFGAVYKEHPGAYSVIGDRALDISIAQKHGLPSVGCLYGYGNSEELQGSTVIVYSPSEIYKAVKYLS